LSTPPDLLLFDLGGVLVDFSGPRDLAAFMRTPEPPAAVLQRWAACPHTARYEGGLITAPQWAEHFVRDWDIDLAPDEFLSEFRSWSRGFYPGARELLRDLRPTYRLAALSNSNALHWERNDELGILREFDFAMTSHELGCAKPDPAIFRLALDKAALSADRVMFFDDLPANVAGARACGITAFQVDGIAGLRECLAGEGLLIEERP